MINCDFRAALEPLAAGGTLVPHGAVTVPLSAGGTLVPHGAVSVPLSAGGTLSRMVL